MKDGRPSRDLRDARRAGYWHGLAVGLWLENQNQNRVPEPTPGGNGGCSKGCLWTIWIVFCFFIGVMVSHCSK